MRFKTARVTCTPFKDSREVKEPRQSAGSTDDDNEDEDDDNEDDDGGDFRGAAWLFAFAALASFFPSSA